MLNIKTPGKLTTALTLKLPLQRPAETFTERELIAGIVDGDKRSIDTLYQCYSSALYGIIYRIIKTEEVAQDILQDTFVKIWRSINTYNADKGRLFTWMVNIARNLSIDFVRSKYYRNSAQNDDIEEHQQTVERNFNFTINPELIDIRKFVNNLGRDQKKLIHLVYFQGFTQSEAAKELNIPLGTVKTRIRLSILALRKYYN